MIKFITFKQGAAQPITVTLSNMPKTNIMRKFLFFFCLLSGLILFSCNEDKKKKIAEEIIGEWVILSDVDDDYPQDAPKKIIFKTHERFILEYDESAFEDTTMLDSGQYFILENRKREAITIFFLPDSKMENNSILRPRCWNFDFVVVNDSELRLAEPTQYENRFFDTSSTGISTYTQVYVYKKAQ